MATQPTLGPGAYVQLNPSNDSPRAALPSAPEKTIGVVKQAITAQGEQYFLVVWNPGDKFPRTGTYHADQLTAVSQQDAQTILQQMASGTYTPNIPKAASNFIEPSPPAQALPQTQQPGLETL